jgi:hypothetical protein
MIHVIPHSRYPPTYTHLLKYLINLIQIVETKFKPQSLFICLAARQKRNIEMTITKRDNTELTAEDAANMV